MSDPAAAFIASQDKLIAAVRAEEYVWRAFARAATRHLLTGWTVGWLAIGLMHFTLMYGPAWMAGVDAGIAATAGVMVWRSVQSYREARRMEDQLHTAADRLVVTCAKLADRLRGQSVD